MTHFYGTEFFKTYVKHQTMKKNCSYDLSLKRLNFSSNHFIHLIFLFAAQNVNCQLRVFLVQIKMKTRREYETRGKYK